MLRHIVLMRMDAAGTEDRSVKVAKLTTALTNLVGRIGQIRSMAVENNVVDRSGNWDLALIVDFDNADDLEVYRAHPEHVAVLELINQLVADRCAVDFIK